MKEPQIKLSYFYFTVISTVERSDLGITLIYQPDYSTTIRQFSFFPNESFPSGLSFSAFEKNCKYVVGYTLDNGKIRYMYADKVQTIDTLE